MCTHTCMCMATKTITITEDAYGILAGLKRKDESFSEVINRTFKKGDIMKFAGMWGDMTDKEADERKENLRKMREFSDKKLYEKLGINKK